MPLDGEKLEELLSGYLDGMLDEHESVAVEALLSQQDSAGSEARDYLAALRHGQELLGELKDVTSSRSALSSDFTLQLLDEISESDKPVASVIIDDSSSQAANGSWKKVAAAIAALAACLAIAVFLLPETQDTGGGDIAVVDPDASSTDPIGDIDQGMLADSSDGTPEVDPSVIDVLPEAPELPEVPKETTYVSELQWTISMVMVLHVKPTDAALESGVLQQILGDAGIQAEQPIVASGDVEEALQDSEYIVTDAPTSRSSLYFVRAPSMAIDTAFQRIFADVENFPEAQYNFAVDNPQTRLMEKVARSTGKRFAASDSFAAPLAISEDGRIVEKLPRFQAQEKLVAKQQREPPMIPTMAAPGSQEISTVLILVELPE